MVSASNSQSRRVFGVKVPFSAGRLFCVVFRSGGPAACRWDRTLAMSRMSASARCAEVERGGRKALVVDYEQSLRLGLPQGWDAADERVRQEAL